MSFSINPILTTNAAGSFRVTSDGFIQGTYMADPAVRYFLAGGIVGVGAGPMWGGMGVCENIPNLAVGQPSNELGGALSIATSIATTSPAANNLTAFTVFDQSHAMVSSVSSPVPVAVDNMSIDFFRLGSGARITVACDPALASLEGAEVNQQVSWDFVGQKLVGYSAAWSANTITGATWANTGGGQITFTTNTSHGVAVGTYVTITGVLPAGYNGTWKTISGTTSSTLVVTGPATTPGGYSSGGALAAGGGALPCRVLNFNINNSMVVSYSTSTKLATWDRSGTAALILI